MDIDQNITISAVDLEDDTGSLICSSYNNSTVTGSISYPSYTPGAVGAGLSSNLTYTSGAGFTNPWATTTTAASPYLGNGISSDPNGVGKLKLNGEGADVEINGVSLSKVLIEIQERLNMLTPNPQLEAEWDQLRELGQQYRELEAKLKEQNEMWTKLKAMPAPDIG